MIHWITESGSGPLNFLYMTKASNRFGCLTSTTMLLLINRDSSRKRNFSSSKTARIDSVSMEHRKSRKTKWWSLNRKSKSRSRQVSLQISRFWTAQCSGRWLNSSCDWTHKNDSLSILGAFYSKFRKRWISWTGFLQWLFSNRWICSKSPSHPRFWCNIQEDHRTVSYQPVSMDSPSNESWFLGREI